MTLEKEKKKRKSKERRMRFTKVVLLLAVVLFLRAIPTAEGTSANIVPLSYGNISKIYQGDWLAIFYAPGYSACKEFMSAVPSIAKRIDTSVQIALIDASESYPLQVQFHVDDFPVVYYVHDGECRQYGGSAAVEEVSKYANGDWILKDPIIGPLAPCGMVMRLISTYANIVTGMYIKVDTFARKHNINTLTLVCTIGGVIIVATASLAVKSYLNISDVRIVCSEKMVKEDEKARPMFVPDNDGPRSPAKGQKIEISRTATIYGKKSSMSVSPQRRKRKK